ncbi:TonB-dependent receptor [Niveispirillum sp. BGYR6]|uniref:TonB-dependent receptor n=1 Tax=Niveispirillum sp. BGYR6 TaxID=2971249 RepID=UPI0022B9AFF2|nr:TonB-dependent receptor [Niveispirillum sp. BGYR6]MDG5497467.1 TonB-dependent receptor [Niveispirillum sp. BGYR6]
MPQRVAISRVRLCLGLTLALACSPVRAAEPQIPAMPAGPLERTLDQLAAASGLALVMRPADMAGRQAPALPTSLSLGEALARVCAPAGLSCVLEAGGILVLPAAPAPRKAAALPPFPSTPAEPMEELVVTGRRGITPLDRLDLSYSLSSRGLEELAGIPRSAGGSALLVGIPGIWADTSAGVAANTIRARGIPLDGYSGIAVLEDGLPVQQDVSLPWADVDQFFRLDDTIIRSDYVRGGPASLFASGALGGTLNLTTRPAEQAGGSAAITLSDRQLRRLDAQIAGPLSASEGEEGWSAALGGFWARDAGVRDHVAPLQGGQVRLSLAHPLEGGALRLNLRRLDDRTFNTSSFPLRLEGGEVSALAGFDPLYGSWFGPDLSHLRLKGWADQGQAVPFGRNNVNRLTAGTLLWDQSLSGGTRMSVKARLRQSDTDRYSIASAGPPLTGVDLLSGLSPRFAGQTAWTLAYSDDGSAAAPGRLVARVSPTLASISIREAVLDLSVGQRTGDGDRGHDFTAGLYAAGTRFNYRRRIASALVEMRESPRLLDVLALAGDGRILGRATDGGVLNPLATYEHTTGESGTLALYLADEWRVAPGWRLDSGVRHERLGFNGTVEPWTLVDLGDAATLADDAVAQGTGEEKGFGRHFAATALSVGLMHRLSPDTGLFARGTYTFRMPGPGNFRNDTNPPGLGVQHVWQGEVGLNHRERLPAAGQLRLNATLFWNDFRNIAFSDQYDDEAGRLVRRTLNAKARTVGLELEADWQPAPWFDLAADVTLQDARFRHYLFRQSLAEGGFRLQNYNGNLPRRIPRAMMGIRPQWLFLDGMLTVQADWRYLGRRYGDDANSLPLPSARLLGAGLVVRPAEGVELSLRGSNLTNALAVMQGDANSGEILARRNGNLITARTLPGRAVEFSLRVSW